MQRHSPFPQVDRRIASLPQSSRRGDASSLSVPCSAADTLVRPNIPMAAASATAAVRGALLPHALLSHSAPPPQVLAVASSFRRLSLHASPRRTTHVVARADASAEAGEPEPESEAEPVTASGEAEEAGAEGAVAVAEKEEEEAADEPPPPPSKPTVKFGEIIGVSVSSAGFS